MKYEYSKPMTDAVIQLRKARKLLAEEGYNYSVTENLTKVIRSLLDVLFEGGLIVIGICERCDGNKSQGHTKDCPKKREAKDGA